MIKICCLPDGSLTVALLSTQETIAFRSIDDFDWALAKSDLSDTEKTDLNLLKGRACWFNSAVGIS